MSIRDKLKDIKENRLFCTNCGNEIKEVEIEIPLMKSNYDVNCSNCNHLNKLRLKLFTWFEFREEGG